MHASYQIEKIIPPMFSRSKILVDLPKILQSVSFYYPMEEVVTTNCHKPFKNKTSEAVWQ
jgi:hypothetical protein